MAPLGRPKYIMTPTKIWAGCPVKSASALLEVYGYRLTLKAPREGIGLQGTSTLVWRISAQDPY